jgi:hypothetical protein
MVRTDQIGPTACEVVWPGENAHIPWARVSMSSRGAKLAFTTDEKGRTSGLILRPKAGENLHAKRTADLPSSKRSWLLAVVANQGVQPTGADHEVSFDRGSGNVAIKLSVEGKIDALSVASQISSRGQTNRNLPTSALRRLEGASQTIDLRERRRPEPDAIKGPRDGGGERRTRRLCQCRR